MHSCPSKIRFHPCVLDYRCAAMNRYCPSQQASQILMQGKWSEHCRLYLQADPSA